MGAEESLGLPWRGLHHPMQNTDKAVVVFHPASLQYLV